MLQQLMAATQAYSTGYNMNGFDPTSAFSAMV
jgi:hypothetical protein